MNNYLATYGKPRFLGIIPLGGETHAEITKGGGLAVVCSHRGEEIAEIVGTLDEEQEREYRTMRTISEHGEGPVRGGDPVVTDLTFGRIPTEDDLYTLETHIASENEILHIAHELTVWHKLPIKLVDAEYLLDEKKLFFYFTSDQRVDFRTLVKDLARRFKIRIELRQMGVRDEARIIKGLSSCGLPCCCSYWLNQFAPIGIRMVKEQNIALNPAKISGICGRLMCCMSFEHKAYKELWDGMPSPGSKIKTPGGNYIVLSIDVAKKALRCHRPSGGDVLVPVELFGEFKQAVTAGEEWEPPQPEEPVPAPCKSVSCIGCRNKCEKQSAKQRFPFAKAAPKRDAEPERETSRTAQPAASDGESEKSEYKRSRRRGRRGGRGNRPADRPEGQQLQATAEKSPQEGQERAKKRGAPKPPRPQQAPAVNASGPRETVSREPGGEAGRGGTGEQGEQSEQKISKRPRHRRRRPKRLDTGAPEVTE